MTREPLPSELAMNPPLVTEILTRFVRSEITRTGFNRAVLGLSGGIDSSVVAFLAARALGAENVLAVTMPYKTSSDATRNNARQSSINSASNRSTCRSLRRSTLTLHSFPRPTGCAWLINAPVSG